MRIDLTDQHAIVTGGASGIGAAIARTLTSAGATVHVIDKQADPPIDVSDSAALEHAFARLPDPDIVIINAGTSSLHSIDVTPAPEWDRIIAVNLTAAYQTLQLAARRMKPRRKGSIVLTASTNSYDGEPMLSAYNASKAGLLGILHTAAAELGPYGIRVNAVCPGLIRTPLTQSSFDNPQVLKDYFRHMPLGRGGEPDEVANAVAFLASDLASYITGAALLVDGGQLASKFGTWSEDHATFAGDRWVLNDQAK
jgi:meso-butanediol dehydrogenase/(S,S)-butanediol dehydrogenase/diacetyl reductase